MQTEFKFRRGLRYSCHRTNTGLLYPSLLNYEEIKELSSVCEYVSECNAEYFNTVTFIIHDLNTVNDLPEATMLPRRFS